MRQVILLLTLALITLWVIPTIIFVRSSLAEDSTETTEKPKKAKHETRLPMPPKQGSDQSSSQQDPAQSPSPENSTQSPPK